MSERVKNGLPDLIISNCPLGCNKACEEVWINDNIGHKIVCSCICHYKKDAALVQVEGPNAKATSTYSHPAGISK
jgi:hypothetical protein